MAKSIRSKRKRMFRSIKRQRYAVKELKRLKDMLGITNETTDRDVEMTLSTVANVVDAKGIKASAEIKDETIKGTKLRGPIRPVFDIRDYKTVYCSESESDSEEEEQCSASAAEPSCDTSMEHSHKRVYDKKTMRDQFGNYPLWFKSRDIKKMQLKEKLRKKKQKMQERQKGTKKPRRKLRKRSTKQGDTD